MNKMRLATGDRKQRLTNPSRFKPYKEVPFTADRMFRPQLNHQRETPLSSHKIRMRKIASRQIEDHFETRHVRYRSKQNNHCSSFKKKAKKINQYQENQNQFFWVDKLAPRLKGLKELNEQYLADVAVQLDRRQKWSQTQSEWNREQKVINQYNIIYEYREGSLPIAYLI